MTQTRSLHRLRRAHWRGLERALREAYRDGYEAGLSRAHGLGRRGRTIRADATVDGLVRLIERHFGLGRYGFEVRVVHRSSKKRVTGRDLIAKYRVED